MPPSSTDVPTARVPAAPSPGPVPARNAGSVDGAAGAAVTASDVEACLRVLAAVTAGDLDGPAAVAVERAVALAHRGGKKRRKADRAVRREEQDRLLLATAARFREEIPSAAPALPAGGGAARPLLHRPRRCYVCKEPFRQVDADYHQLCPACAEHNRARRDARCDLTGRRAVVTGGRVKIGFHTALKLLRDGAEVLVTTRFPRDAARRFAAVPDFARWGGRLHVHGADFLDLAAVIDLVDAVGRRWDHLDILVNNAAQTLHRPPAYHREVRAAELLPLAGPAAAIGVTPARAGAADTALVLPDLAQALFPAGRTDETGQPLDLRDENSWTLRAQDVSPREWLEVHVVNAFVPFLLTSRLRPLLAAAPHPVRHVVQVSAMEGSFARENKTERHPHTNMAKAGLNMLTRTLAADFHGDGILMNSVDTGWVTDERPHPDKQAQRAAGFRPPLDVIDGAARVYDPIVRAEHGDPVHGAFLKDYRETAW
ncbi:SDR family oxidoreductase [Catellatospora sp. NPDC049609]|uniref:SDR family NAD(P)-dependent oxidoreductase n=1 Tax=Catellatospora sp. NPDC049609 TaxID=3155505 RepID=UPI00341BE07D